MFALMEKQQTNRKSKGGYNGRLNEPIFWQFMAISKSQKMSKVRELAVLARAAA